MSEQINNALEEAKTTLDEVSTTDKSETPEPVKAKVKKETVKKDTSKESTAVVVEKEGKEGKEDNPPKERPKRKPPSYKTIEWALQSRKLFKISPEVMVIALRLAGKKDNDMISVFEAKSIVQAFLKREVK